MKLAGSLVVVVIWKMANCKTFLVKAPVNSVYGSWYFFLSPAEHRGEKRPLQAGNNCLQVKYWLDHANKMFRFPSPRLL